MPDHTNSRNSDQAPALLTITEAADLLRAPVATLRYWRHCNTGPRSFRLGRRVLYRREDLLAWIDARHHADRTIRALQNVSGDPAPVSPRRQSSRQ